MITNVERERRRLISEACSHWNVREQRWAFYPTLGKMARREWCADCYSSWVVEKDEYDAEQDYWADLADAGSY